jgi:hypothetical protein
MSGIIYTLCALTAFICAVLLLKAHYRTGYKLLLWGGLCFAGVTLSNGLLVIDKIFTPSNVDLSIWRYSLTLMSLLVLLYGLIWEKE